MGHRSLGRYARVSAIPVSTWRNREIALDVVYAIDRGAGSKKMEMRKVMKQMGKQKGQSLEATTGVAVHSLASMAALG